MSDPILQINKVSKRYAGKTAVDQISLDIPRGIVFGMLGPNGAGKTSLIRMITSITAPDEGTIFFEGKALNEKAINQIGYMPEERGLYKKMKVGEHLIYLFRLRGMDKKKAKQISDEWLEKMEAGDWAQKQVGDLSKGMQQKIQFIATVAHNPPLLILDEPFSGLDPLNSHIIEQELKKMTESGTTIIFSTHRMEQVEEICNRIGLINNGKLVLEDDVNHARKSYFKNQWLIGFEGNGEALKSFSEFKVDKELTNSFLVTLSEGISGADLLRLLSATEVSINKVEAHMPRLNEIFRTIVQQEGAQS